MKVEVVRCIDCFYCKNQLPRSIRLVKCSEGVFEDLSIDHPYIIVYRTCEKADVEEEGGD